MGPVVARQERGDADGGGDDDPSGDEQGEVQAAGEGGAGLGGDSVQVPVIYLLPGAEGLAGRWWRLLSRLGRG